MNAEKWKCLYLTEEEKTRCAERKMEDCMAEISKMKEKLAEAERNIQRQNEAFAVKGDGDKQKHKEEVSQYEDSIRSFEAKLRELEKKRQEENRDLRDEGEQWRIAAKDATRDIHKSVRLLVTAPKVAINVGGDEMPLTGKTFPHKKIKDAVCSEIIPRFSKCIAVSEKLDDGEVKALVQQSVEELALALQSKLHELMPQAEGTCNWDGFGAKRGSLAGK